MNGNIYINGAIGTFLDDSGNVVEKGVELLDVILQVKNQPKAERFNVYINSPGGYVDVGFEISDYLRNLGKPITTIGQGLVGSIATVIFMSGSVRKLKPNTEFLIHLPSGGIEGTSHEIEEYSKYIKDTESRVVKYYSEHTGLSTDEITPLLKKETILTPDEAFKLGFATEKPIATQVVAYYEQKQKQEPMSKKQKGILTQIADILKGAKIENKIVFDVEQNELDFYELSDDEMVKVGDKANYEGASANGEYKVASEDDPNVILTYIFEGGVLTEIVEPEEEVEVDEEMKAEIEELKRQLAEKETAMAKIKEENKSYKLAINKIKMLQTEVEPEVEPREAQPKEPKKVNPFVQGIMNLKNRK